MAKNMKELKKNIKAKEKLAKKQRAQEFKALRADDIKKSKELLLEAKALENEAKAIKKKDKDAAAALLLKAKNLEKEAEQLKNKRKKSVGIKTSRIIGNIAIYVILIAITIVWLAPFVGIVLESFKAETNMQTPYLFPKEFGFKHYVRLFTETDFLRWFANTAIMGVATAIFQTVFILSMSYVLSRMRFKGRKLLMNMMLILGMFPGFLTMILIYKVFADAGLTMQMAPLGLIIVYCASSAMGYYVSKGFFDTIPKSLDEAARVDGATRFQVFYKVIMPLSKPIVIYTILMGFMAPWGDFMMASYIIHENSKGMNVAVGMYEWLSKTNLNTHYTMFCAAGVVVAIPVVIVFLALQKYYVEGVTGGAVKG